MKVMITGIDQRRATQDAMDLVYSWFRQVEISGPYEAEIILDRVWFQLHCTLTERFNGR